MANWNPRANAIFLDALEVHDPLARNAFVHEACHGETDLCDLVLALLHAGDQAGSFLDRPAVDPILKGTIEFASRAETASFTANEIIGTRIGPYKLLQQIGEGGMGTVYMAEQTEPVRRQVALKLIKPGMDSRQVIARFEAERQALALMDHVNIARVFDGGTTESGRPYFVMELVHGVPITKYCDDNHLTPRQRLELFVPVCQAIQHAHQKGIIHRDIKPSNVMVTLYDGKPVPKVIDFGVAKAIEQKLTERTLFTQYGTLVGTLEYMSPEQAEMSALGVDTRSDIYSLGVLLYELLTGSTPLSRKRVREAAYLEVVRMIREEEPQTPSMRLSESGEALASISAQRHMEPEKLTKLVRGELDWIVMKTLEKDRNRRYETASAFAADLQRYLADETVLACPPSAGYRFRKFARRNKAALGMAAAATVVVGLAVVGLAASTLLISREQQATANALSSETRAKNDLGESLEFQRRDAYFHRIALAHRELSADDLARALELLRDCPDDLRGWEWYYLMRLCRVEPVVFRDRCEINGLAFSGDGERIASAGRDGALKIWDGRTGTVIRMIEAAHTGAACSVAFHPAGTHLASVGGDKLVKVWDLKTGRVVFTRPCDSVHILWGAYAVAFDQDGRRLAAGNDGTVTVWDWENDRPLHIDVGYEKRPISVAFSKIGRLATGSWRGHVRLLGTDAEGEPFNIPETLDQRHPVSALAFSKDSRRLAAASFQRRVDVWDTTAGDRVHSLAHGGLVTCVAFSSDGRRIVSSGEDKIVRVWDSATGREVLDLRGHTGICSCLAFSPDGCRLASASKDGTIRVWDATPLKGHEGQEMETFRHHGHEIWSLAVSRDGSRVVSGGFSAPATVWDARTGAVKLAFDDHRDVVFSVAWHADGQRIASAGADRGQFTVKVWNAGTGVEAFSLPSGPEYFTAAFSPHGRELVTGQLDGTVRVWEALTGKLIRTLGTRNTAIRGVAFSCDGRHLATAGSDGVVQLWDATRLSDEQVPRHSLAARVHGPCLNVAFSPDGDRLATGGNDDTVVIWDVQTGKELRTLRGHSGDVYTVAFSPDGHWIASAGEDSAVRVWDATTGECRHTFRGHIGLVSSLAFLNDSDGLRLITGSRDRTIKVWDVSRLESTADR